MKIITTAKSVKGIRKVQQDRFGHIRIGDNAIMVVADGNGGNGGGELAEIAVKETISSLCFEFSQEKYQAALTDEALKTLGLNAVNYAAQKVMLEKFEIDEWADAGTTITLVIVTPLSVGAFWIGDSPAYLYCLGELTKLTTPAHTLLEKLTAESPNEELKQQHGLNSILTRCAGHTECKPDYVIVPLEWTATVIVGSDGVFNFIPQEELLNMLKSSSCWNIFNLPKNLLWKAFENATDDNMTVVASCVVPDIKVPDWESLGA